MQTSSQHPKYPGFPFEQVTVNPDYTELYQWAWRDLHEPLFRVVEVGRPPSSHQASDVEIPDQCWLIENEATKRQVMFRINAILFRREYVLALNDIFQYASTGGATFLVGSKTEMTSAASRDIEAMVERAGKDDEDEELQGMGHEAIYPSEDIINPFLTDKGPDSKKIGLDINAGGFIITGEPGIGEHHVLRNGEFCLRVVSSRRQERFPPCSPIDATPCTSPYHLGQPTRTTISL